MRRLMLVFTFVLALVPVFSLASSITEINFQGGSTSSDLSVSLNGPTTDLGELISNIFTCSGLTGCSTAISITAGNMDLVTLNPVSTTPCGLGCTNFTNTYGPGGSVIVAGSLFGLPAGTILLTGTFLAGALGFADSMTGLQRFDGNLNITSFNPTLAASLGLSANEAVSGGAIDIGQAMLSNGRVETDVLLHLNVSVVPEPTTLVLVTSGLIALFTRKRL